MRGFIRLLVLSLSLSACAYFEAEAADPITTTSTTAPPTTATTTAPPRDCSPEPGPLEVPAPSSDPVALAIAISGSTFACAEEVVLAPISSPEAMATASHLAGGSRPLLFVDSAVPKEVLTEIERLDPTRVVAVDLEGLPGLEHFEIDRVRADPNATTDPLTAHLPSRFDRAWLFSETTGPLDVLVSTVSKTTGDAVIPIEVDDLRLLDPEVRATLRANPHAQIVLAGAFAEDASWQLDVALTAEELPGGGLVMFPPATGRRLVALYGNPTTPALGVLGEQGAGAGVDRLIPIAEEYAVDGVPVLPSFEIIATVASSRAGTDGDYSDEMSVELLRPWVETARERGVYVIIDLQPGRTDFLTQAKRYEELLRQPHVGLALDPEWRLGPDQVHLRQIGTVDAAEINTVATWLAGIVREDALPQKLFLLHQFRFSMITNRELVETPSELAVVIQMDGQGPLHSKYETWNALTAGWSADSGYLWGWKNFYDEDSPTATADQVLGLTPVPVYVSFQ